MKVGDLVMLSAHGCTLDMMRHRKNKVGIIIECKTQSPLTKYKYKVRWLSSGQAVDSFVYHRRDLKFATTTPQFTRHDKNRRLGT